MFMCYAMCRPICNKSISRVAFEVYMLTCMILGCICYI